MICASEVSTSLQSTRPLAMNAQILQANLTKSTQVLLIFNLQCITHHQLEEEGVFSCKKFVMVLLAADE